MSEKSLSFPTVDGIQPNTEHQGQNGVTYTWSPEYSTWMIGSTQQVNKDYVDMKDALRLKTDGTNWMYGNLQLRNSADDYSDINLLLSNTGSIFLDGSKSISFAGDGGTINVSNTEFVNFNESKIGISKTISLSSKNYVISELVTSQNKTYTLLNVKSTNNVNIVIDLGSSSNSQFKLNKNGVNVFRVTTNGYAKMESGSADTTMNIGDSFYVKNDGRVLTNNAWNSRLIGSNNSSNPVEDHALATKGYVDSNSFKPGTSIVALSESDAEIGGFWRRGNNLYLRIS